MSHKIASYCAIVLTLTLAHLSESLRTGAPSLACVNLRPFHGLHSAKPASASQFFVTQSSLTYAPGQNITVEIMTQSSERYFRGFIVQAYNPITGANIGRFLPGPQVRPLDGCSAATHRENLNKKQVTLTWVPPSYVAPQNDLAPSVASQWLGLQQNQPAAQANTQHRIQPSLTMTINRQRRWDEPAAPAATPAETLATAPEPTTVNVAPIQPPQTAANGTVTNLLSGTHQVRFRATIVVTYEDFYTGFDSAIAPSA